MSWLKEHKRVWRVAILAAALVAIAGPWTFDVVNVPSKYTCSAPHVRLDNDFCGIPLPGTWVLRLMVGLVFLTKRLVTGSIDVVQWARESLFVFFPFLLVLPGLSTLLLVLGGDHRRRQVFNIVAWGLAAGIGLLIGVPSHPRLFWVLWGVWLYIALAASALILELLMLRR